MFYLRVLITLLGFVIASIYGIAIILLRRDRSLAAHDYGRMLSRLTQRPLGIRKLEVHGEENLYANRPCIYLANHQSNVDTAVLGAIYPADTVLIAKKEVRSIPLFGWVYAATGNIFIDRSNRVKAVAQLKAVGREIRRRGMSVWIFPEGTRGRTPGRLLPFKKGAFQMAIAAQCPLVPVVISPVRTVMNSQTRTIRPGVIEIRVLEPIPTAGMAEGDVDRLMEETRQRMQDTLDDLVRRRGLPPGSSRPALERSEGSTA